MGQELLTFLTPNKKKGVWFTVLMMLALAGEIQTWAFGKLPPKPPLYDLLAPFPCWTIWVFVLSPLFMVSKALKPLVHLDVMSYGPEWAFHAVQAIYVYGLSCLLVVTHDRYKRRLPGRLWQVSLITFLALLLVGLFTFLTLGARAPSYFITMDVLLPYGMVSVLCLYFVVCLGCFLIDTIRARAAQ